MGIPTQDDLVSNNGSLFPKGGGGVMAAGTVAQEVELDGYAAALGLTAETSHLGTVEGLVTCEMDDIRMHEAGECARVQTLGTLIHVVR